MKLLIRLRQIRTFFLADILQRLRSPQRYIESAAKQQCNPRENVGHNLHPLLAPLLDRELPDQVPAFFKFLSLAFIAFRLIIPFLNQILTAFAYAFIILKVEATLALETALLGVAAVFAEPGLRAVNRRAQSGISVLDRRVPVHAFRALVAQFLLVGD